LPWYNRVLSTINTTVPFLIPTQATNLALLVSAILKKRTLCLSELARAYPTPTQRQVPVPKHDLLHRLKRLWRFTDNERVDALEVQMAFLPHTIARLGYPRLLGLAIDWTMFNVVVPSGERIRHQVLRIAVPRRGRALPLLQLAYDRDDLPATKSQNQLEQDALLAVIRALPAGVRPVVLVDRGFARATFFVWLKKHHLDYVVRVKKGTCLTEADGRRWKPLRRRAEPGSATLGAKDALWSLPWPPDRDPAQRGLVLEDIEEPSEEPSAQATRRALVSGHELEGCGKRSLLVLAKRLDRAIFQRCEEPLFGLAGVRVGSPERLSRLLMALTIALTWLTLMALPEGGLLPKGFRASVSAWGRASVTSLALSLLEKLGTLPPYCLPQSHYRG
jgi:hypothetical protein